MSPLYNYIEWSYLDYVPSFNKEATIMKNANKIITIEKIASHFFKEGGMVSFFKTKTAPNENATIMNTRLMDGSI